MENRRAYLNRLVTVVAWRRRLLAAGLAAGAVALAIEAAAPSSPDGVTITVAERDLDGGTTIRARHLTEVTLPAEASPSGVVDRDDAVGGVLAGPMRAGEPVTDRRLVDSSLLEGWGEDLVAAPVRVADAEAISLIEAGDRINLLAAAIDGTTDTRVVAARVPVLTVSRPDDGAMVDGALVVVATTAGQAAELAQAAVTSRLSFTISPS